MFTKAANFAKIGVLVPNGEQVTLGQCGISGDLFCNAEWLIVARSKTINVIELGRIISRNGYSPLNSPNLDDF